VRAYFSILALVTYTAFASDGIYGTDDRTEVHQAKTSLESKLADSTVAIVESANLKKNNDSSFSLKTDTFGSRFGLCKNENFYNQPVGSSASAALVGPDLILTAAHTITDTEDCLSKKIVFGFSATSDGGFRTTFPAEDVAQCKEILVRDEQNDFLIFRLDRKILNHEPLSVNRAAAPQVGDPLIAIGHPSGLPMKLSPGRVLMITPTAIITDTDTYGGNSGSPIFNSTTGLIEGVLSRGGTDFINNRNNGCVSSVVVKKVKCKKGYCYGGETAVPSSLFEKHIPELTR
jgi:hypothetical protein